MSENNIPYELNQEQEKFIYELNVKFHEVKEMFDKIRDLYIKNHNLGNGAINLGAYNGEGAREKALAITNLEQAFMWADKACKFQSQK